MKLFLSPRWVGAAFRPARDRAGRMGGACRRRHHGTRIVVELWAPDAVAGNRAIEAVLTEMRRIDAAMSTYKPDSEVSQVNARAAAGP